MKNRILQAIVILLICAGFTFAEYFPDVIVTSPKGIWTDTRAYSDLNSAITAIGSNTRDLYIVREEVITTATINANTHLHFFGEGSIANSGQLDILTKDISAGNRQIFTGAGIIEFANGSVLRSSWFANLATAIKQNNDYYDYITLIVSEESIIAEDVEVGDKMVLKWEAPRARISINSGFTLSNIKRIEAGDYQIFTGSGDIDFLDGSILKLSWFKRLRSFVNWIESENVTLEISNNSIVDYTDTIANNVSLKIFNGGMLNVNAGIELKLPNKISAGNYQIFSGLGDIDFSDGTDVLVSWCSTLPIALAWIEDEEVILNLNQDDNLSASDSILANTTLKIGPANIMTINTGVTLTFVEGSKIDALSDQQIFNYVGTGKVVGITIGHAEWWGNNTVPGTTDMTDEIQAALAASDRIIFNYGPYLVSDQIEVEDNSHLIGPGKFIFSGSMVADNLFYATGKDNIKFSGLELVGDKSAAGASDTGNGIAIVGGNNIIIEDCIFYDFPQDGPWLKDCTNYRISGNEIYDIGMASSSPMPAAIKVIDESADGNIFGNFIDDIGTNASGGHGIILIQHTGGTSLPVRTNVYSNNIRNVYSHGIVFYSNEGPEIADANVFDNLIENTGLSTVIGIGNGIYFLWGRGMNIHHNKIVSPNTNTPAASIIQAAIAIMGNDADVDRQVNIDHNQIEDCGKYRGIYVYNVPTQTTVSKNQITDCTNAEAIRILDVQNFVISDNIINEATGQNGVRVLSYGAGAESTDGIISGNLIDDCGLGIYCLDVENVSVLNNRVTDVAGNAYRLEDPTDALISGNYTDGAAEPSMYVSGGVNVRINDNLLPDKTNYTYPYVYLTGDVVMEFYSDTNIFSSTWTVGSRARVKTPVAGSPKGWMCTVAGAPGTWVAESNL